MHTDAHHVVPDRLTVTERRPPSAKSPPSRESAPTTAAISDHRPATRRVVVAKWSMVVPTGQRPSVDRPMPTCQPVSVIQRRSTERPAFRLPPSNGDSQTARAIPAKLQPLTQNLRRL
ncbi:hypothetical protein GCM10022222_70730 [Amycolatopsis ultiminotia]|uniref:Uncharacterized protein n=1 Tax=Amycolatopsis ultiminotia TaxID=543629 RepID=A0ABP6Y2N2_9PSEU